MAGHSGLTERWILNELNVIVAKGAEKSSKVIVYSTEEPAACVLRLFVGAAAGAHISSMMRGAILKCCYRLYRYASGHKRL
jgi:hypothetical protein